MEAGAVRPEDRRLRRPRAGRRPPPGRDRRPSRHRPAALAQRAPQPDGRSAPGCRPSRRPPRPRRPCPGRSAQSDPVGLRPDQDEAGSRSRVDESLPARRFRPAPRQGIPEGPQRRTLRGGAAVGPLARPRRQRPGQDHRTARRCEVRHARLRRRDRRHDRDHQERRRSGGRRNPLPQERLRGLPCHRRRGRQARSRPQQHRRQRPARLYHRERAQPGRQGKGRLPWLLLQDEGRQPDGRHPRPRERDRTLHPPRPRRRTGDHQGQHREPRQYRQHHARRPRGRTAVRPTSQPHGLPRRDRQTRLL